MSSWVVLVIGLVLCFLGVGSTHLAVLATGFAVCWLLAAAFGAGTATALLISGFGAVLAWVLVSLIFRTMAFFLGTVLGSVIGAKIFTLVDTGEASVLLAVVLVPAVALVCGFLASRFRERFLLWATALGGSALVVAAIAYLVSGATELDDPRSATQGTVAVLVWLAIAIAGWLTQRRVFARRLQTARR
ncbi:hypothetical protein [Paractinoplanes maris]|uniref:hypothetical protein n=1 Tax=Paractinoplanes maris TaxID=1734446 RepID=UPI002020EBC9|nr:hypothetical protein [Actinoplanes maris]